MPDVPCGMLEGEIPTVLTSHPSTKISGLSENQVAVADFPTEDGEYQASWSCFFFLRYSGLEREYPKYQTLPHADRHSNSTAGTCTSGRGVLSREHSLFLTAKFQHQA